MDYLKLLEKAGFIVTSRKQPKELSVEILNRYPNIPATYLDFLTKFEQITNKEDTSWFNSIADFNGETETDFSWNAFELMSIEACEEDEALLKDVVNFWDYHIPILMSVTEYQYLAICLIERRYGEIVYGVEPEFEETTKVCNDFEELMLLMNKPLKNQYLTYFI